MEKKLSFKKKNGIYYTNSVLAKYMVQLMKINYHSDFSIVEPGVGSGQILSIVIDNYLKANRDKDEKTIKNFLEKNIFAFDIRNSALTICIENLNQIVKSYYPSLIIDWNIKKHNVMSKTLIKKYENSFDYVISNPPYISKHHMNDKVLNHLKEKSVFCDKYNFDFYYYFFEVGLKLWSGQGKMVFITPNSYLRARSGKTMLNYFLNNELLEGIIDFEDSLLFEDATTYTAISIFSTDNEHLKIYKGIKNKRNSKRIKRKISYKTIDANTFSIYKYKFPFERNKVIKLGDISEIRNGLATLRDKIFIIKDKEIITESDTLIKFMKNDKCWSIEKSLLKKVVRPSNPTLYEWAIFPYHAIEENKNSFKRIDILRDKYPLCFEYLSEKIDKEHKDKYDLYFGRTQGFRNYINKKIIVPKVAHPGKCFSVDEECFVISGLYIVLNKRYESYTKQLCDFLNSQIVTDYLNVYSKNYASGYKNISSIDIRNIEIPINLFEGKGEIKDGKTSY